MITHLNVFIILITAIYAVEIRMGRRGLKQEDLNYWITKSHKDSSASFPKGMEIKLCKLAQQDCFLHSVAVVFWTGSAVVGIHRYSKGSGTFLQLCMFKPAVTVRPVTKLHIWQPSNQSEFKFKT